KVRHGRAFEARAGWFLILFNIDIRHDDIAGVVDVIAIYARDVVNVFLDDGEATDGRIQSFASSGKLRDADEHTAFVKISALFAEADLNRRFAPEVIAVPIRYRVFGCPCCRSGSVNATQILSLAGKAHIFLATCDKKR